MSKIRLDRTELTKYVVKFVKRGIRLSEVAFNTSTQLAASYMPSQRMGHVSAVWVKYRVNAKQL